MGGNQAVMGKVATLRMNLLRRDESIKTREQRARARGARMCWLRPLFLLQNQFRRFMPWVNDCVVLFNVSPCLCTRTAVWRVSWCNTKQLLFTAHFSSLSWRISTVNCPSTTFAFSLKQTQTRKYNEARRKRSSILTFLVLFCGTGSDASLRKLLLPTVFLTGN